jgi:uncharacterized membrane protein
MTAAGLHGNDLMPVQWRHVIYVTEDIDQACRILAGIVGHGNLGISLELVRERLHLVEAVRLDPAFVAQVGKIYREQFTRIVNGVEVLPLVVLDTKSAVMALENENDNSETSRMMAALKQDFAALPVWLIGHVSKVNIGASDVTAMTDRGAGSSGGDCNQTLFFIRDGESRFLAQGKHRFESRWTELEITTHTAQTEALDVFGNSETVVLRWGVAAPVAEGRARKDKSFKLGETQQAVMALLRGAGKNMRIPEIAEHLAKQDISRTSVYNAVNRLRDLGLLEVSQGMAHLNGGKS